MPNWCSEFITFTQEDGGTDRLELLANDLKRIYEVENRMTDEELMDRGWSKTAVDRYANSSQDWIGRLILNLGVDIHSDEKHIEAFYLRGFIQGFEMEDGLLQIQMSSAWGPCVSAWYMICDYYDLTFVLSAEEPGCDVYINTDQSREIYPEIMKVSWIDEDNELYDETDDVSDAQDILRWLEEEEYIDPIQDFLGEEAGNLMRHESTILKMRLSLTMEDLLSRYDEYLTVHYYEDIDEGHFDKYQKTCQDLYGQPSLPVKWTDR